MSKLENITLEQAKEVLKNHGYIAAFWNKEDIEARAEEMEVTLTKEQVQTIADNIERSFDANVGVNWDVITYHIDEEVQND
jgi:ribosomal protein S8